jgi:hypothetical protein
MSMVRSWLDLSMNMALLGFEAQRVVALRLMKLTAGGAAAQAEAQRMVTEKAAALMEATTTLALGGSARQVVRRYRSHVRANERRLSRVKRQR